MKTFRWIAAIFLLFLIFQPRFVPVSPWSYKTHILIADLGFEKIIEFLPEIKTYSKTVTSAANVPDNWKNTMEDEGLNHIYYYSSGFGRADRVILSWTIYLATELSTELPDFSLIAQITGILSHYIADISMPMHCTSYVPDSNYNHGDIDGWLESSYSVHSDVASPAFDPEFISDFFNYTMIQIFENYRVAKDELFPAMSNNDTQRISEIVEKQITKAVKFLINAVYTAYSRSNETNIETVMNPHNISLIEIPQLITPAPIEQRLLVYLLILGVIAVVVLHFFRKNRTNVA